MVEATYLVLVKNFMYSEKCYIHYDPLPPYRQAYEKVTLPLGLEVHITAKRCHQDNKHQELSVLRKHYTKSGTLSSPALDAQKEYIASVDGGSIIAEEPSRQETHTSPQIQNILR